MPELPEVETLRRMLESRVRLRTIQAAHRSRARLHVSARGGALTALAGRRIERVDRRGKYLLFGLDAGWSLLSHLGMSGRWLFWPRGTAPDDSLPHVHLRLELAGGGRLWYQDVRRFGMLRVVPTEALGEDPSLRRLGPDPLVAPPTGDTLRERAKGSRTSLKSFLLDQRHIAGLGNIYVSEILFRAAVDPRLRAGSLSLAEWARVAAEIVPVLEASIARMGTTFSTYRTIWNEPGQYGDQLLVYDRGGEPCRRCGVPVRRIVQAGRSTYFCPTCQSRRAAGRKPSPGR